MWSWRTWSEGRGGDGVGVGTSVLHCTLQLGSVSQGCIALADDGSCTYIPHVFLMCLVVWKGRRTASNDAGGVAPNGLRRLQRGRRQQW